MNIPWREYFLIERGKFPMKKLNPRPNRQELIHKICEREEFRNPDNEKCSPKQRYAAHTKPNIYDLFSHFCIEVEGLKKILKCERSNIREGLELNNGECCCHGCLKKNKRKLNYCNSHRTTRAAHHPQYQPLDEMCLTSTNCTCVPSQSGNQPKRETNLQNGKPKPQQEIKSTMLREKQRYEERRKFHTDISTYHNKNPRNQKSCGKRGLACYTGIQFITKCLLTVLL